MSSGRLYRSDADQISDPIKLKAPPIVYLVILTAKTDAAASFLTALFRNTIRIFSNPKLKCHFVDMKIF